jgi:hypothetical protein
MGEFSVRGSNATPLPVQSQTSEQTGGTNASGAAQATAEQTTTPDSSKLVASKESILRP